MRTALGCVIFLFALLPAMVAISAYATGEKGIASVFGISAGLLLLISLRSARPRRPRSWRDDPATERQREFAADLGIVIPKNATKGQASAMIDEALGK